MHDTYLRKQSCHRWSHDIYIWRVQEKEESAGASFGYRRHSQREWEDNKSMTIEQKHASRDRVLGPKEEEISRNILPPEAHSSTASARNGTVTVSSKKCALMKKARSTFIVPLRKELYRGA